MNDLYDEEYALKKLENLKTKTEMYKSATKLMNILSVVVVVSTIIILFIALSAAETFLKIF